jgi:hypothetical protein
MNGGAINGNRAGSGGGVYLDGSDATFTMSGGAIVAQDNDVYLKGDRVINVSGLTGSVLAAKITPENTVPGTTILSGVDSSTVTRFTLNTGAEKRSIVLNGGNGVLGDYKVYLLSNNQGYATLRAAVSAAAGANANPDTIVLLADIDIASSADTISLTSGKHIRLVPYGGAWTVKRGADGLGSLFTVESGASLTLEGNGNNELIIDGDGINNITATAALVTVSGGTLTMNNNAVLQNNSNGGVAIQSGGVFEMTGGTVGNNSSGDGGGVYVREGTFNMRDGVIENNVASHNGGGVNMGSNGAGGEFNFSGGLIQNNKCLGSYGGGGVTLVQGDFFMSGNAVIKNNEAVVAEGGGVCLQSSSARFIMTGGKIYGINDDNNKNIAAGSGHALYNDGGTVTINSNNETRSAIDETIS